MQELLPRNSHIEQFAPPSAQNNIYRNESTQKNIYQNQYTLTNSYQDSSIYRRIVSLTNLHRRIVNKTHVHRRKITECIYTYKNRPIYTHEYWQDSPSCENSFQDPYIRVYIYKNSYQSHLYTRILTKTKATYKKLI
jgi:hypothetical protein